MPRTLALLSLIALLSTCWPIAQWWRAMRRTALAFACAWSIAAVVAAIAVSAASLWDPVGTHLDYLRLASASLVLAPIIAVFGARRGTNGPWNWIVAGLLLIFALPLLEQGLLGIRVASDRVALDGPRVTFYAVIAAAGVINYVPTRFGPAACLFGASLLVRIAAVGPWDWQHAAAFSADRASTLADLLAAAAVWLSFALGRRPLPAGLLGAWLRFRDGWGLVWAARFRERWNATAAYYGWTTRIAWRGLSGESIAEGRACPRHDNAVEQFATLARRFADPSHFFPQIGSTRSTRPEPT